MELDFDKILSRLQAAQERLGIQPDPLLVQRLALLDSGIDAALIDTLLLGGQSVVPPLALPEARQELVAEGDVEDAPSSAAEKDPYANDEVVGFEELFEQLYNRKAKYVGEITKRIKAAFICSFGVEPRTEQRVVAWHRQEPVCVYPAKWLESLLKTFERTYPRYWS